MTTPAETLIGTPQIAALMFLMLGPLKILVPFVKVTQGADGPLLRRIALLAFAFATGSLFLGMYLGEKTLGNWNVGLPALMITAGALLFFVAFRFLVSLYDDEPDEPETGEYVPPTLRTAINPLTFPVIATPYGIAILIFLRAAFPDRTPVIVAILGGIMVLNLVAMFFARAIIRVAGLPLQLIGTILTVLQAALGVQFLIYGIGSVGH